MIMYSRIKQSTLESLDRYVNHYIPTGSFLEAVLSNNLMEAVGRADEDNYAALRDICSYVYNEIPSTCHGSPQRYAAWIAKGQR